MNRLFATAFLVIAVSGGLSGCCCKLTRLMYWQAGPASAIPRHF
jgi:hypothetical protein